MGMDPVTLGLIGGSVIGGIGDIWGANSQANTNQANLQAAQAHNAMIQQYVNGMMQQGTNPYSSALMNFLGMAAPASQQTFGGPASGGRSVYGGGGGSPTSGQLFQGMGARFDMAPDPTGGMGFAPADTTPNMSISPVNRSPFNPIGGGGGGIGGGGISPGGAYGGGMYGYGAVNAAQVSPFTLGSAPQVGMNSFQAPQLGGIGSINPMQLGMPGMIQPGSVYAQGINATPVQAQQLGQVGGVNVPTVGTNLSVGTQGYNTGQDALMQALRASPTPGLDPTGQYALMQQASNPAQFDMSGTAKSLTDLSNFNLQNSLDQLHASAGDLGKRFGTGMQNAEAQLRGSVQNNLNATLAPLYQQSFESAQGRQLGAAQSLNQNALGLGGLQTNLFGTQLGALQNAGQLGLAGAQLSQQAQTTNAANQLAASQANAQNMLQAGLATQGANVNIGLANQGAALQASQLTAAQQLAAQQANAANALQAGQFNAGQSYNAQQQNIANMMNMGQFGATQNYQAQQQNIANMLNLGQMNLGAQMQAGLAGQSLQAQLALANQQMQGQYGMANANILNQAGQFNATNANQMAQFNAQQGNVYNQFMMGAMGQAAGLQNTQNQYNAGLLSLLAGQPIPQQQPSPYPAAISGLGSTISMIPFMSQMMQGGGGYGGGGYAPPNVNYGNLYGAQNMIGGLTF